MNGATDYFYRRPIDEGGKEGDKNLTEGSVATVQWAHPKLSDLKPQLLDVAIFLAKEQV